MSETRLATKRELIATVMHLRFVGAQLARFINEQMPLFGGCSTEFEGKGEPRGLLKNWRRADRAAATTYAGRSATR